MMGRGEVKGRKSFLLRLEAELFRAVEEWAQQEMRSVNGQIEWILKEACERRFKKNLSGGGVGQPAGSPDEGRGEEAPPVRESSRPRGGSGLEPLPIPHELTGAEPLPYLGDGAGADPTLPLRLPDLTEGLEPPPRAG